MLAPPKECPSVGVFADLAQQVEHIHGKDGVVGSSPAVGIGGQFW